MRARVRCKPALLAGAGVILIAAVMALSMRFGAKPTSFATVWDALFRYDAANVDHVIIRTSRLPRVAGALLIGAFLAVSGALMQGITRNDLASPSIMGVSDGSAFMITLCMILFPGEAHMPMILYSLVGSALGALLVFGAARLVPGGMTPVSLALLGTIIGTFLSGVSQAMAVYFQISQPVSFWYNARLHQIDPAVLKLAGPFAIVGLALAFMLSRSVTALSFGDEVAAGLGLNTVMVKTLAMISVVILSGISVAIAGKIAFVGLMVPHIARFLVGTDYRRILPFAALFGAVFLAWCDLISRFLNFPFETPVGVVTALFGVPFLLYLIKTRGGDKRHAA